MYINCGAVTALGSQQKKEKKTSGHLGPSYVDCACFSCTLFCLASSHSLKTSVRLTADSELGVEYENELVNS